MIRYYCYMSQEKENEHKNKTIKHKWSQTVWCVESGISSFHGYDKHYIIFIFTWSDTNSNITRLGGHAPKDPDWPVLLMNAKLVSYDRQSDADR